MKKVVCIALFLVSITIPAFPLQKILLITPQVSNLQDINSTIITHLQDLNWLINAVYLSEATIRKAVDNYNTKVPATQKITLKNIISPTDIPKVSKIVSIDKALFVSITPQKNIYKITIALYNNTGKMEKQTTFYLSLDTLNDFSTQENIRFAILDLFNVINNFAYIQPKTGKVSFSTVPPKIPDAQIVIKRLEKTYKISDIIEIPEGEYNVVILAKGYTPVITNIVVKAQTLTKYNITLQKEVKKSEEIATGSLIIEANVKDAPFTILEAELSGKTPMYIPQIKTGTLTIIFDETAKTKLKKVKVEIKENEITHIYVDLEPKGGLKVVSDIKDTVVAINRLKVAVTKEKETQIPLSPGTYGITLYSTKYHILRTNVEVKEGETAVVEYKPVEKEIPVYITTIKEGPVPIEVNGKYLGLTPVDAAVTPGMYKLAFMGTNVGYYNLITNINIEWGNLNNVIGELVEAYGDLRVITKPTEAEVYIDNEYKGKTADEGLSIKALRAKKIELRIEKEDYKPVITNIFVVADKENVFSVSLKYAPAKLYISTYPEKDFEVYLNNEKVGLSGKPISSELGTYTMKLSKPGYITIITNVELTNKGDYILRFSVEKGKSDVEVMEEYRKYLESAQKAEKENDVDKAYENYSKAIETISNSIYLEKIPEFKVELAKAVEAFKSFKPKYERVHLEKDVEALLSQAQELKSKMDYDKALEIVEKAKQRVNTSGLMQEEIGQRLLANITSIEKEIKVGKLTKEIEEQKKIGETLIAQTKYEEAIAHFSALKAKIEATPYIEGDERIKQYQDLIEKNLLIAKVLNMEKKGDEAYMGKQYEDAMNTYDNAISEIEKSIYSSDTNILPIKSRLKEKRDKAEAKYLEVEGGPLAKKLMENVSAIVEEGDMKLLDRNYKEAVRLYENAITALETSPLYEKFKELKTLKEKIEIKRDKAKAFWQTQRAMEEKIKELETQVKGKQESWWYRVNKGWVGFGFHLANISFSFPSITNGSITADKINYVYFGSVNVSFLPILGVSVGGFYTLKNSELAQFFDWGTLVELYIKIPIIEYVALNIGGLTGFVMQGNTMYMPPTFYGFDGSINLKYHWIGISIGYKMFLSPATYHNIYAGIDFWLTER